jgi:hypothetical protein
VDIVSFYATAAQLSFVLLGFWWAILTFQFDAWMGSPARRAIAYYISLHFLLPGIMSLVSIISIETSAVWRVGFGAGGLLGAASARMTIVASESIARANPRRRTGLYLLAGLNLAVVAVAAFAPTMNDGVGLEAIHVEAILTALLIFVGVQLAWWLFVDARQVRPPATPAA